jgi:hypothetical protein
MRHPDRPGPDDERPHEQRHAEPDEPVPGEGPRALARHRAGVDQPGDQEEQTHREQDCRDHQRRQRDVADRRQLDLLDVLVGPRALEVSVRQTAVACDDHGDQQQFESVEVRHPPASPAFVDTTRMRFGSTLRPRFFYDGLHELPRFACLDCERLAGSPARQP